MSNISVDLKVIEVYAPMVARALSEPVALTLGGLNLLWHRCWSTKQTTITRVGLAGIFGPDNLDLRIEAMVDARFLEPQGDAFRVRGAEKYLRIREGNSKGGEASKSNLIPGGKKKTRGEDEAEGGAEGDPRGSRGGSREGAERGSRLDLGSSPNTEHRTPNTSEKPAPASRAPRETDALCADFKEIIGSSYVWQGEKDGTAFAKLRKSASLEEIRTRWRTGLKSNDKWKSVRTVAQLASKWNDLAQADLEPRDRSVLPSTKETVVEITQGF